MLETTYLALLIVQALHLLHHRLAKQHISYVEVIAGGVLCIPLTSLPAWLLMSAHLALAGIQIIGSIWIDRLSPQWDVRAGSPPHPP